MKEKNQEIRLFRMGLTRDPDVVTCRNRVRSVAARFGFDRQNQIRIATAVSEIARNAFRYARGATAEFLVELLPPTPRGPRQRLVCVVRDQGPGIHNLDDILSGNYQSSTGMGMGITGAHRLMDRVEITTSAAGTSVRMEKDLPAGRSIPATEIPGLVDSIISPESADPEKELAVQNQEILFMIHEVGEKKIELNKVNEELSETNRGVVALYDELDTIYRVGHVLASKLDLDDLLQAIIDATAEISGAELGIFVYQETGEVTVTRQYLAVNPGLTMANPESLQPTALLEKLTADPALLRIHDLTAWEDPIPLFDRGSPLRSCLAIPISLSDGTLAGAMVFAHRQPGVFSDRSERILSSVAMQASVGIENARLYKSARSASAAKDRFLAILSHELRNPLNPIFARLSLIEEDPSLSSAALESIRLIRRNLELETRLIDDLLDMTRIAHGKLVLQRDPVDLHAVITAAIHACSGYSVELGVTLKIKLDAVGCVVMGDPVRLQQVFWNLINNAIKFSSSGGEVLISTHSGAEGRIQVHVKDHGRGITPGRAQDIFEPFEQDQENTSGIYGGLGLGLAISKNIIFAHDGEIEAFSDGAGLGTVLQVILATTSEAPEPEIAAPLPSPNPKKNGWSILLVDDHLDTRMAFQTLLSRRGHQVTIAATVEEALEEANSHPFQLLISDIGLPGASGYDLMRELSASQPHIKGIAVSGYGMKEDITRSEDAGFSLHLTKPLSIAALEEAIHAVMHSALPDAGNAPRKNGPGS